MIESLTTPSEIIKKQAKQKAEEDTKSTNRFFEFSDKFIIWLLGFCIASISLIMLNYEKIYTITSINIKAIIFFLGLTIILGLIYRIFSYAFVRRIIKSEMQLDNWLVDYNVMTIKPEDLSNKSIAEITGILLTSFLKNMHIPDRGSSSDSEYKTQLIEHYNSWCRIARNDFDEAINHVAEAHLKVYNIPKSKTIYQYNLAAGLIEPKPGDKRRSTFDLSKSKTTVEVLFGTTLLTFMTAVILLMIILLSY